MTTCLGLGGRSPQQERVAVVGVGGVVVVVVVGGVEESKIVVVGYMGRTKNAEKSSFVFVRLVSANGRLTKPDDLRTVVSLTRSLARAISISATDSLDTRLLSLVIIL